MRMDDLVGILLAAGRSRRFGGDKMLYPLADGTPMALASANALRSVLPRTVIVIRKDHPSLAALFAEHGIETVVAERADAGMGASLAAGIAATVNAPGWVVALGDMPFIQPRTIACVAEGVRRGAAVAAPVFQGRRGHPVGFSARHGKELSKLCGEEGARTLLQRRTEETLFIACNDPGVLVDIDQRQALEGT